MNNSIFYTKKNPKKRGKKMKSEKTLAIFYPLVGYEASKLKGMQ